MSSDPNALERRAATPSRGAVAAVAVLLVGLVCAVGPGIGRTDATIAADDDVSPVALRDPVEEKRKVWRIREGLRGMDALRNLSDGWNMHSGIVLSSANIDYKTIPKYLEVRWAFNDGKMRRPDMMGNYMAGYSAGYSDRPLPMYACMRLGGIAIAMYSLEDRWDLDSVPDINAGFADGYVDFVRHHPLRAAYRVVRPALIWSPL